MHRLFNDTITKGVLPDNLKLADVIPFFKKDDRFDKKATDLSALKLPTSKIYEKLMQRQINDFITNNLSPYLCGYIKGYNTKQGLVSLTEKFKILDDKGVGTSCYSFNRDSLKLISNYLPNRWQRKKVSKSFSSWAELVQGAPLRLYWAIYFLTFT